MVVYVSQTTQLGDYPQLLHHLNNSFTAKKSPRKVHNLRELGSNLVSQILDHSDTLTQGQEMTSQKELHGFYNVWRSQAHELLLKDPNAFLLLHYIAQLADYKTGTALITLRNTPIPYKQARNALHRLTHVHKLLSTGLTQTGAQGGTVVTILNSTVCDLNNDTEGRNRAQSTAHSEAHSNTTPNTSTPTPYIQESTIEETQKGAIMGAEESIPKESMKEYIYNILTQVFTDHFPHAKAFTNLNQTVANNYAHSINNIIPIKDACRKAKERGVNILGIGDLYAFVKSTMAPALTPESASALIASYKALRCSVSVYGSYVEVTYGGSVIAHTVEYGGNGQYVKLRALLDRCV